jgi:hypothetical protein
MDQPFAFLIISQALAWHGFPIPWLRKLSCSPIGDEGFATGEYLARWGRSLIDEHYSQGRYFAKSRAELMQHDLQACFADDIMVTGVGFDAVADEYLALLYVRVDPSTELWFDTMVRTD